MPIGLGLTLPNLSAGGIYNRILGAIAPVEQLLLDAYPNAAAAYSTRLLNTAYTGPVVRVRRSNDNAEQDIGFANGNLDEAALTTFVGANSAFVTTWYDQSGNARHATQTTAANQPRIVNAGVVDKVNGRVSVVFPGTGTFYLANTNTNLTSPVTTTFATALKSGALGGRYAFSRVYALAQTNKADFVDGSQIPILFTEQNTSSFSATPPDVGGFSVSYRGFSKYTYGSLRLLTSLFSSTSHTMYSNGVAGTTVSAANTLTANVAYIGAGIAANGQIEVVGDFNGNISEVILYPSDQSATRVAIESNIILHYFGPERLLNQYANAAAAYSTRQLDRFYTGPALRVRRSNDNAEMDIGFSAGNFDEAALTAFVGANSAFVTTWYDQSGNARNATQATAANQPRIVNAGVVDKVNGRVSPAYNGTSTFFSLGDQLDTVAGNAYGTGVLNYSGDSATLFAKSIAGAAANRRSILVDTPNRLTALAADSGNVVRDAVFSITPGTYVLAQQLTSGSNNLYLNSTQVASNSFPGNAVNDSIYRFLIGAYNNSNDTGQIFYTLGFIPELVVYLSDQSANRAAIEANIMSYFGITA